jgi:hypothetical protein
VGNSLERHQEHVVQHEHNPFGWLQLLRDHQQGQADLVVEGYAVGRAQRGGGTRY